MKNVLIFILLIAPLTDIDKIARTNELKKEAKAAFLAGKYEEAIQSYHYLLDSMGVDEDGIRLNMANAYYHNQDTTSAEGYYNQLRDSENATFASRAYQQLGVIKNKQKKKEEALADFKQALRKNPANEEARYNYELLKKLLEEEKEQQKDQQQKKDKKDQKKDQEQQQKDQEQEQKNKEQQENQEKKDQEQQKKDQEGKEGEEKEQKDQQEKKEEQQKEGEKEQEKKEGKPEEPSDKENKDKQKQDDLNISPDKLKEMNISEEKAKMILEAMKNQEIQYLQQNKRKAQKRPDSGKPDW